MKYSSQNIAQRSTLRFDSVIQECQLILVMILKTKKMTSNYSNEYPIATHLEIHTAICRNAFLLFSSVRFTSTKHSHNISPTHTRMQSTNTDRKHTRQSLRNSYDSLTFRNGFVCRAKREQILCLLGASFLEFSWLWWFTCVYLFRLPLRCLTQEPHFAGIVPICWHWLTDTRWLLDHHGCTDRRSKLQRTRITWIYHAIVPLIERKIDQEEETRWVIIVLLLTL